jgi:hypothetical protein
MVSKEIFDKIKEKHGDYASWAIWKNGVNEDLDPRSMVDDMSIFDLDTNPQILQEIKPNIVMVGLNWSGDAGVIDRDQDFVPFHNFHYVTPHGKDYMLRYAFRNSDFYGAYMTDIIKYYGAVEANPDYINDPQVNRESKEMFETELKDLDCENELIIAFGGSTYQKLHRFFGNRYNIHQYNLKPATHYSWYGTYRATGQTSTKENYRDLVLNYELKNWRR